MKTAESPTGIRRLTTPVRRLLRRDAVVIPVIRLSGAIGAAGPGRQGMSLQSLEAPIEKAFSMKSKAVALSINCPGGSPVQSALIAQRIRELASERDRKVYAFVEDVAASGGYWLACAADEIYADTSSIIGSIGVVSAGFGFTDFIRKHGVERRLYASGSRKALLDPFQEQRDEDVAKLATIMSEIHEAFRAMVRDRRAGRLTADEETLFSGEFWTGSAGLDLGLIDSLGHMRPILKERFGPKVVLKTVNPERGGLRQRLGLFRNGPQPGGALSPPLARDLVDAALASAEERALWQRFGL